MKFIKIFFCCSFISLLFALSSTAIAASIYQEIKQQVQTDLIELYPNASINIDFISPNTHKKNLKCNNFNAPSLKKIPVGGRVSIRLTCKQPKWSTYLSLKISIYYIIATARSHILKGETLTVDNIYFQEADVTKLSRSYFSQPKSILGKAAKRNIKKHQPINPYMLVSPTLIMKGDSVIIEAGINNLNISTIGTALQNGIKGRQIRVKNNRSGRVIRAYVTSKGRVSTNPD